MIDHVSLAVSDIERALTFYEQALAPLGLSRLVTRPGTVGFGKSYPEFWINLRAGMAKEAATGTWMDATLLIMIVFVSVLLHEFGHCAGAH